VLNLEETILISYYYNIQKDFYLRSILYISAAITFLDLLRSQITEINLLQLVPGYYLLLVLISFLFLLLISTYSLSVPLYLDNRSEFGTKTIARMNSQLQLTLSIVVLTVFLTFSLNTIVPIALDAFDSYDKTTLTDLWSFDQVLRLETSLLIVLTTLSQLPTLLLYRIDTEVDIYLLNLFARDFGFLSFVGAGVLTPTVDGYTQVSIALGAIVLYGLVLYIAEKGVYLKLNATTTFNF
jgi:hypothetical protein